MRSRYTFALCAGVKLLIQRILSRTMLAEKQQSELDFYSPLQGLVAECVAKKREVQNIVETTNKEAFKYFFDAAEVRDYKVSVNIKQFFESDPVLKAVDAEYWEYVMNKTDILSYMSADQRYEWGDNIRKHNVPEFTIDNVKTTMLEMHRDKELFLARRVDGIFRALSPGHLTNSPMGFGKRFILAGVRSEYTVDYKSSQYLQDLRCVVAKLLNREAGVYQPDTYADLFRINMDGQWNYVDGGAFKIRMYKKGTAHIEFHPEIACRLNQLLAFIHPHAIPSEFRTKPKKPNKEYALNHDLIGFDVVNDLLNFRYNKHGESWYFLDKLKNKKSAQVVEYIGGVDIGNGYYKFGYDPEPIINYIRRTGTIPEYKSHQYYPTPEHIARDAVAMAEINDGDFVREPSAGQGAIAEQIREAHPLAILQCVEISKLHCEILKQKGFEVVNTDFLQFNPERKCDKLVMNPPFSDGRAIDHAKHGFDMLADGGVLVSVLPASFLGKEIIPGCEYTYSHVYKNEFAGCSVNVVIVRICK